MTRQYPLLESGNLLVADSGVGSRGQAWFQSRFLQAASISLILYLLSVRKRDLERLIRECTQFYRARCRSLDTQVKNLFFQLCLPETGSPPLSAPPVFFVACGSHLGPLWSLLPFLPLLIVVSGSLVHLLSSRAEMPFCL